MIPIPSTLRRADIATLTEAMAVNGQPYRPRGSWWATTNRLVAMGLLIPVETDDAGRIMAVRPAIDQIGAVFVGRLVGQLVRLLGTPSPYSAKQQLRLCGAARWALVADLRARDGDDCCHCGVTMNFEPLSRPDRPPNWGTIEHGKVPFSIKPTYEIDELTLACLDCNHQRGLVWRRYRSHEATLMAGRYKIIPAWPALYDSQLEEAP